jgi:hypothetical protein
MRREITKIDILIRIIIVDYQFDSAVRHRREPETLTTDLKNNIKNGISPIKI